MERETKTKLFRLLGKTVQTRYILVDTVTILRNSIKAQLDLIQWIEGHAPKDRRFNAEEEEELKQEVLRLYHTLPKEQQVSDSFMKKIFKSKAEPLPDPAPNFSDVGSAKPVVDMGPMILVARQLQDLVKEERYDSLSDILDKVLLPHGCKLGVQICKEEGVGDVSVLKIVFQDGKEVLDSRGPDSQFWKILSVEKTPMGAWQAYLLWNIWTYLPLFWHGGYSHRDYLYEPEQMMSIYASQELNIYHKHDLYIYEGEFDSSKYDIAPRMFDKGRRLGNHRYNMRVCFWNDWVGLVRDNDDVIIDRNNHVSIAEKKGYIMYPYHINIRF